MEAASRPNAVTGRGWLAFAGTLFLVVGVFNVIDGIAALATDKHFLVGELFFWNLDTWGVIHIVLGGLLILTGVGIYAGRAGAAIAGVVFAFANACAQLLFIGVYPVWSVIIIVIDFLVIYALTVHSDELTGG